MSHEEREPINTTLPWANKRHCCQGAALGEDCDWSCPAQRRVRSEPITQVEYERAAYHAMTRPGDGEIHPMSITTPTYEPNRAMAPGSKSIIAKKGLKPPREATYAPVTFGDRIVYGAISVCVILIAVVIVALFYKLG